MFWYWSVLAMVLALSAIGRAQETGCLVTTSPWVTSNCTLNPFVNPGEACTYTCDEGYAVASGDTVRVCVEGQFTGEDVTCEDFDACASNPCNSDKSDCIDEIAPSTEYVCKCAKGHTGPDSADGEVCEIRKAISAVDFGLHVLVNNNEDVKFQFGTDPQLHSMRGMIGSISILEDAEESPTAILSRSVASAMGDLRTALQGSIDDLSDDLDSEVNRLDAKIDNAITKLGNTEVSLNTRMQKTESNLDDLTTSTQTAFQAAEDYSDSISSAVSSTDGRVTTLSSSLTGLTTLVGDVSSVTQSVSTAGIATDAKADSAKTKAEAATTLATTATNTANSAHSAATGAVVAANQAKSSADTANALASHAKSTADDLADRMTDVESKLSTFLSTLGCLATGCDSGTECNPTSRKCETATLIAQGFLDSNSANAINSQTGDRWNSMCYKRSTHGASSSTFHSRCNSKSPLLIITRGGDGRIWGGYTSVSFVNAYNYRYATDNYLWRYYGGTFTRTSGMNHPQYAIYDHPSYGPTFGGGHDWHVNSGISGGYTYRYSYYGNGFDNTWLAGSYSSWSVSEMEVYY
jgi:hypothetical protein